MNEKHIENALGCRISDPGVSDVVDQLLAEGHEVKVTAAADGVGYVSEVTLKKPLDEYWFLNKVNECVEKLAALGEGYDCIQSAEEDGLTRGMAILGHALTVAWSMEYEVEKATTQPYAADDERRPT